MTTAEAAAYLGVAHATLWRWIKRGAIPATLQENTLRTRAVYRLPRAAIVDIKRRIDDGEHVLPASKPGRKPRSK